MKTILVLGANGKVGSDLMFLLKHSHSYNVIGIVREKQDISEYHYEVITDLLQSDFLARLLTDLRPDYVINAIGIASPDVSQVNKKDAYNVNYQIASCASKVCSELKVGFIQLSTDYIFSGIKANYVEEDIPDPINYYGLTKLLGEVAVRVADTSVILRLPYVIFRNIKCDKSLQKYCQESESYTIDNEKVRRYVWTPDLCRVIDKIVTDGIQGEIFHVCGDDAMTKYAMIQKMIRNWGGAWTHQKGVIVSAAQRPPSSVMSNTKMKDILKIQPTSLEKIFTSGFF